MIVRIQILDDAGKPTSAVKDVSYNPRMTWDENLETVEEELDGFMHMHEQAFVGTAANAAPAGPATDCWNARRGRPACAKACGPNGSCVLR